MKKRLSTILAVMFMAVILIPFTPVQAASTDVTGKMAGNREIKNISKMMTAYTTAMNLSEQTTATQQRNFVPRQRSFLVRALPLITSGTRRIRIMRC